MTERVNTVVVGGGQAGLSMSHHLTRQNREHLVIERSRVAEHWRSRVWDAFCLVTPNWTVQLPGMPYDGPDPDGFMGRNALVAHLERYAAYVNPPIRTGVAVTAVRPNRPADGYTLDTTDGTVVARNVVVATGGFQLPHLPRQSREFAASIHQIHSSEYRNPGELPDGAVLVVGTGQSGAQIAEELYQSRSPGLPVREPLRQNSPAIPGPGHHVVDVPDGNPGPTRGPDPYNGEVRLQLPRLG